MAKVAAENVKFVDDLQQALIESLAVFPDSELKSELKLIIENIVGRRDVFGHLQKHRRSYHLSKNIVDRITIPLHIRLVTFGTVYLEKLKQHLSLVISVVNLRISILAL